MRWSKRDIKRMTGELDGVWLRSRPPPSLLGPPDTGPFLQWLSANRQQLVVEGLKGLANLSAHREQKDRETAEHWLQRFDSREVHDRFRGLAEEEVRKRRPLLQLIARIEEHGLPPEVVAYDPTCHRAVEGA